MNETRPSDTISNDLMAMRHAHEAITIALKSCEYNGEIISAKEQKKLPINEQIMNLCGLFDMSEKSRKILLAALETAWKREEGDMAMRKKS